MISPPKFPTKVLFASVPDREVLKSDGLTMLGLQNLSETVRDYMYLILMSQTSTRGPIVVGHEAQNLLRCSMSIPKYL